MIIRREEKDIQVRKVQWTAMGLVLSLGLIALALLAFHNRLVKNFHLIENWPRISPRGQSEFESGQIREQLQKEQEKTLFSYQGIQGRNAWVQVPLERAMNLVIEKKSTDPKLIYQSTQRGSP